MLHKLIPVAGTSLLVGSLLASCSDKPVPEYRLTTEQLAWQPYHTGDMLRFGQARSSKVRTFTVTAVDDRVDTYSQGGNAPVYLGPPSKKKLQRVDVYLRRTDTLRYMFTPTSTAAKPDSMPYTSPTKLLSMGVLESNDVYAYLNWDIGFSSVLPLKQLIEGGALPDTARQLLPSLRLGNSTYGPVVRLSNVVSVSGLLNASNPFPRVRPARLVYYAKGYGVVGFVEGSTLWYRLP